MSAYQEIQHNNVIGHLLIKCRNTGQVLVNTYNAIHFENISVALANSLANKGQGFIHEMQFGNGGTNIDPTGIVAYSPANTVNSASGLYNMTYSKVVDENSLFNLDPSRNNMTVSHIPGENFTDILIRCVLDYGEPAGQGAFDNSENINGEFVFDEMGLRSWGGEPNSGDLLTHVVFHPVQKSLNRVIEIEYTIRIQTLTTLSSR